MDNHLQTGKKTFQDAISQCASVGMTLATFTTKGEFTAVFSLVSKCCT